MNNIIVKRTITNEVTGDTITSLQVEDEENAVESINEQVDSFIKDTGSSYIKDEPIIMERD